MGEEGRDDGVHRTKKINQGACQSILPRRRSCPATRHNTAARWPFLAMVRRRLRRRGLLAHTRQGDGGRPPSARRRAEHDAAAAHPYDGALDVRRPLAAQGRHVRQEGPRGNTARHSGIGKVGWLSDFVRRRDTVTLCHRTMHACLLACNYAGNDFANIGLSPVALSSVLTTRRVVLNPRSPTRSRLSKRSTTARDHSHTC